VRITYELKIESNDLVHARSYMPCQKKKMISETEDAFNKMKNEKWCSR